MKIRANARTLFPTRRESWRNKGGSAKEESARKQAANFFRDTTLRRYHIYIAVGVRSTLSARALSCLHPFPSSNSGGAVINTCVYSFATFPTLFTGVSARDRLCLGALALLFSLPAFSAWTLNFLPFAFTCRVYLQGRGFSSTTNCSTRMRSTCRRSCWEASCSRTKG